MQAFYTFLGGNDMMAYLTMMAPRLVELRRVLKPTGSLYLHCDPTASHYLKLLCDAVFGKTTSKAKSFGNEPAHTQRQDDGTMFTTQFCSTRRREDFTWNRGTSQHSEEYAARYKNKDADRQIWADDNLTGPGAGMETLVRHGEDSTRPSKGSHWKVNSKVVESIVGPAERRRSSHN